MNELTVILTLLEKSGDARGAMLLLGPVAAVAFFTWVWTRYRNQDKSYQFESTTSIKLSNVRGSDDKVGHVKRTSDPRIQGHSRTSNPRDRIRN